MSNDKHLMEDAEDEGLKAVMGSKFHDVSQEIATSATPPRNDSGRRKKVQRERNTAVEGEWKPVKSVPTDLERVRECAKWALLFGAVSGLLFYWQQAGLLDSSAAVPSLIICALGAGLTIGWHAR